VTATADVTPLVGSTTPRLWTRPLATGRPGPCGCGCALTSRTSRGFEAITFATDILDIDLLPWQRWWLIHAFETVPAVGAPGGRRLRFRTVVTLVARQNGKTTLLMIVVLWMIYTGKVRLALGAAQALDIAHESWAGAVDMAEAVPELANQIAEVRRTNGQNRLTLRSGARYRITAATRSAGRGLPVQLLILDELREHRDWLAWGALSKTTMAQVEGLIVAISNAGDDQSVVLNSLRAGALAGTDDAVSIFEWSAPDGCSLDDPQAWCASMPGLGITITPAAVASALSTDSPEVFRTELLCQRVEHLDTAFDQAAWGACADPGGTLAGVRNRVVLVLDCAPDGKHVSVVLAAPVGDDRVRVEVAGAWSSTTQALRALPDLVDKIRPRALGWFPLGPGAVFSADIERLYDFTDPAKRRPRYSPDLYRIQGGDVTAACQGLIDVVTGRRLLHPKDPMLDAQASGAQRKDVGDGFRFVRLGAAHVDAVYACAGAVHIARVLPAPTSRPMVY
jgi:hypothetical protein